MAEPDGKEGHKKNEAEESVQEKAILYQLLQRHLESLTQNAVMLERRYEEIEATRMALDDIGKLKEKNEILIPLGSGFFTYGKITEPGKMLVDVGTGIFVDKGQEASKGLLEEKRQEIEKLAGEMQQEITDVSSRLSGLAMEIQSLSQPGHKHEHGEPEGEKHHPKPGKHPHDDE